MNLLKAINGVRCGTIIPENLAKAVTDGGVSGFTDELRETLVRDGIAFLGHVEKWVTKEHKQLRGPNTRDMPEQFDEEGKQRLTITIADRGAQVVVLNFSKVFETQSVGRITKRHGDHA